MSKLVPLASLLVLVACSGDTLEQDTDTAVFVPDTLDVDAADAPDALDTSVAPDTAPDTLVTPDTDESDARDASEASDTAVDVPVDRDAWLGEVVIDLRPDDLDDSEPLSGAAFTRAAFVVVPPCSRRTYTFIDGCYNEVSPPPPTLRRSLVRADFAPAADTLPNATKVPSDGSVDHRGKVAVLPSNRTTFDGRVSVAGGCDGCDALQFRVFRPEVLDHDTTIADATHLPHEIRNSEYNWIGSLQSRFILWDPSTSALTTASTDASGNLALPDVLQSTLCEATSDRISVGFATNGTPTADPLAPNPRTCKARFADTDPLEVGDCYDLTLLTGTHAAQRQSRWELRSVDLTVFVRDPKRLTTGDSGFPEGATNPIWAYPRDPSGATLESANNAGPTIQILPPFSRFEIARAFYKNTDGSKLLACPDANGNDLTGTNWWECFNPGKRPNAQRFVSQIRGPSGLCFDAAGTPRPGAPGFCEYFFRQHQASQFTVDDNENATLGDGRPWDGTASNCGNNAACRQNWALFESITTGDGRLLVANVRGVFYAYNRLGPCRADGFDRFLPISSMPADPDVNTRYDLARVTHGEPFRDPMGQPIPFGVNNTGAYPWIDRRGRNLFYAAQNLARDGWFARQAQFGNYGGGITGTLSLSPSATPSAQDRPLYNPDHGPGSQYGLLGSWTHGKLVLVDELNVSDFGGGDAIPRMPANSVGPHTAYTVALYSPEGGDSGEVLFHSKGVQSVSSFEHTLGTLDALRPTLPFDVVWQMQTDIQRNVEIAFDPYLNPRAVVVAPMNATLDLHQSPYDGNGKLRWTAFVQDGFSAMGNVAASIRYGETADFRFRDSPRLQNAATAPPGPDAVKIAPYLTVRGGARVEPVGMGGVLGKGLYLDGYNDFVDVPIPAQPNLDDFYLGLWLDLRDVEIGPRPRTIFQFADTSFIALRRLGTGLELLFWSAGDERLRALPIDGLMKVGAWSHLGVSVRGPATLREVDVRVDGTLIGTLQSHPSITDWLGYALVLAPFGTPVRSTIGDPGPTFHGTSTLDRRTWKGWVDELRIYAVPAAEQRHPSFAELACNEALGTLVDVTEHDGETPHPSLAALRTKRAKIKARPTIMCEQLALVPALGESLQGAMLPKQRDRRVCADRVHKNPRPEPDLAARCLRNARLEVPPMTWDAPRPDRSAATFCLTCHYAQAGVEGLRPSALTDRAGIPRWQDPRRQPLQVPARVGGRLPGPLQSEGLGSLDPIDRYFDRLPFLAPLTE